MTAEFPVQGRDALPHNDASHGMAEPEPGVYRLGHPC